MRGCVFGIVFAVGLSALCAGTAAAQGLQVECRTTIGGRQECSETMHSRMMREQRERDAEFQRSITSGDRPKAAPTVYSWRDVKPAPCSKLEAIAAGGNYCEARQQAASRKAVGDTIAQGQCDEALKMALGTGDLDFAREVRDFCRTPAAQ